jgi:hypothetical protein
VHPHFLAFEPLSSDLVEPSHSPAKFWVRSDASELFQLTPSGLAGKTWTSYLYTSSMVFIRGLSASSLVLQLVFSLLQES